MNNPTTTTQSKSKNKKFALILALIGAVSALPLAGLHKFYLGQSLWGIIYLVIGWQSPMARIACIVDIVLYLAQNQEQFNQRFNPHLISTTTQKIFPAEQVTQIATAIRELEKLRQEGLISDNEFEQKRRQLIS